MQKVVVFILFWDSAAIATLVAIFLYYTEVRETKFNLFMADAATAATTTSPGKGLVAGVISVALLMGIVYLVFRAGAAGVAAGKK